MRKELVILRGLPGSGKSTLAREIVDSVPLLYPDDQTWTTNIFSTDDWFTDEDGVYTFVQKDIGRAHAWNQFRTREKMHDLNALANLRDDGYYFGKYAQLIVVDNTNSEWWETKPYVEAAIELGWELTFGQPKTAWAKDVAECARRTKHGVPEAAIQRMADRWQEVPENTPGGNPEYVKAIYKSLWRAAWHV